MNSRISLRWGAGWFYKPVPRLRIHLILLAMLAGSYAFCPAIVTGQEASPAMFSASLRTLLFFDGQEPANSTQNPDNAFLRLYRYSGEFHVRPDFVLESAYGAAVVKPRITTYYRWWEDGVIAGNTDSQSKFFVNEWRLQSKLHDALLLSVGKEKLLWGSSFLVSPSNILFKDTERINPKSEVEGKYLARLIYLPNTTFTINVISRTQREENELHEVDRPIRAVRAEMIGSSSLVGVIGYLQQHSRFRLGSYGQLTASDATVLYYDGIVSRGSDVLYPAQKPGSPLDGEFSRPYQESEKLFTTVTAGGAYTFLSGSTVSLEFLYNGSGYNDAEAKDYYSVRASADRHFFDQGVPGSFSRKTLAQALNNGSPFLRRYYFMMQYQEREIWNVLDIVLRYTHGLEENAGQASSILEWRLSDTFQFFNVNAVALHGGNETEFHSILTKSFMAGIEAQF